MAKNPIYLKLQEIWHRQGFASEADALQFELDLHKRMLGLFGVGDFYYYVFNVKKLVFEYISDQFEPITGWQSQTFDLQKFLDCIHPDDQAFYVNSQQAISKQLVNKVNAQELYYYKVSLDFRLQCADGSYKRMLQQTVSLRQDEAGAQLYTLGIHTDISHLKTDSKPILSIIGLEGRPSWHNIEPERVFDEAKPSILTRRELEIARLLSKGLSGAEVAQQLHLSDLTVATHRKNILRKLGVSNTVGLVQYLVKAGLG